MTAAKELSAFPITPADAAGRVDVGGLRAVLQPLRAANVDSIGLLGSTGTYAYLTRGERRRAIEAAADEIDGAIPLLVGVGALRTDEAIGLAQDAKALGASAGLLAPVSYTPLNEDEVYEHFAAVARESGLPLCIYDNPGTTHFSFTTPLIARLSRLPGVTALKSPTQPPAGVAAHLAGLRAACADGLAIGYSGDATATEALIAGADAWYSVAAGFCPKLCLSITRAAERGDDAEARRLNDGIQPLWELFKEFSSLRVAFAAVESLGMGRFEPPRPILPLPDAIKAKVAAVLRDLDGLA